MKRVSMIRTLTMALAVSTALAVSPVMVPGVTAPAEAATMKEAQRASAKARRESRTATRALARAKRKVNALAKRIARDKARLKKAKGAAKRRLQARIRKDTLAWRKARAAYSKDLRASRIAEKRAGTAKRLVARAQASERRDRRRAEARKKREKLQAERTKAREKRIATARLEREKRRLARAERVAALRAERRTRRISRGGSSWFGTRILGLRDPAYAFASDYGARVDEGFALPAIPIGEMPKHLLRQQVRYRSSHKPGTVVVDTKARYLYLVMPGGRAMRYGIGVGRAGFEWSGSAYIGWKQKWPKWTPPDEMIEREPKLAKWSADNGGQPGGLSNPLGARALYLMQGGKDTLYRLHGTPNWRSIGTNSSSGCIRLMHQDVIDLYERVKTGAKVVVM